MIISTIGIDYEDWTRPIKRGFKFSQHAIAFRDIPVEDIRDYDMVVPLPGAAHG